MYAAVLSGAFTRIGPRGARNILRSARNYVFAPIVPVPVWNFKDPLERILRERHMMQNVRLQTGPLSDLNAHVPFLFLHKLA